MLNMFIVDSLVCQLVSWPFAINGCSWQQWMPVVAGYVQYTPGAVLRRATKALPSNASAARSPAGSLIR